MANDGTVMETEYYRSSTLAKTRFTYSTVYAYQDLEHPVSGNREIGIFANPGGTGYTFHTMGVDRTTNWLFPPLMQEVLYSQGQTIYGQT
jgi:hypothetical protein